MQRKSRKSSVTFYAFRGLIVFVWFFLISKLTTMLALFQAYAVTSKDGGIFAGLSDNALSYVVFITASLASVFIFNSVCLLFYTFDRDELENFLESDADLVSFKSEIKSVFKTPHVLAELITTLSAVTLTALVGGFFEVGSIFFESGHRAGWFPLVIVTPIFLFIILNAKYEAKRYWHYLNRIGDLERVTAPSRFYKRFLLVFFLYPLMFPYSPLLAFIAYSAFTITVTLFGSLTVVGLIALTVLVILHFFVAPALKRSSRRKHITKAIGEIAEREGYTVKWTSDNDDKNGCKFDLTLDGKEFNCLIISSRRRRIPLIFTSPTNAYFEYRLGTREHHISMHRQIDFFLHGKGTKIIIINPSPKHVFVTDGIKMKRLSAADRIWNLTVHDDVSFLGAMERKCLDRYTTSAD